MRPAITGSLLKKVGLPGSFIVPKMSSDAQAPDGQPDAIGYEEPLLIRATMHDRIGHALRGA
jgi:hypothetical protein